MSRSRAEIEADLDNATQEVEDAQDALYRAKQKIEELQDELNALPPENADAELWHARHDPRQTDMFPI
jgi:F0F1-type ATP synthase membrane subunit b/b'